MKRILIIFIALLATAACGDGGTKTGNGVTIDIAAVSSTTPAGAPLVVSKNTGARDGDEEESPGGDDGDGSTLLVQEVRAAAAYVDFILPGGTDCSDFDYFEFEPPTSCSGNRVRVNGPFVVDLINRTIDPDPGILTIPPGAYGQVDVRFDNLPDGFVPPTDPLDGQTFYATGTIELPGETRGFVMMFDFNVMPHFVNPAGIPITGFGIERVLLALDVAEWFSDLPITSCIEEEGITDDPVILSNDMGGECSEIEDELKENIEESGDLEIELED